MGNRLDAKVCLITGAGSGIGQASARLFAQEGARVVVADIDLEAAAKTVAEIGGAAVAEQVDVTSPQDTVDLAKRVVEQFGRIDVLFNNAGIAGIGDVLETKPELFDRVMTGNVRGVSYAASKGAVFAMTKSMQVDLAPHGIRVNALLPGTILTPFVERYLKESYKDPEEGFASIRKRQLTPELGRPEDVASAALYLASDESRFVMASGLVVDGGVSGA